MSCWRRGRGGLSKALTSTRWLSGRSIGSWFFFSIHGLCLLASGRCFEGLENYHGYYSYFLSIICFIREARQSMNQITPFASSPSLLKPAECREPQPAETLH